MPTQLPPLLPAPLKARPVKKEGVKLHSAEDEEPPPAALSFSQLPDAGKVGHQTAQAVADVPLQWMGTLILLKCIEMGALGHVPEAGKLGQTGEGTKPKSPSIYGSTYQIVIIIIWLLFACEISSVLSGCS